MKKANRDSLPASKGFNAESGLFRYKISVKFPGRSDISKQLDVFDAIKKLGAFNIHDQRNHVYILDFQSGFAKHGLNE